MSRGHFSPEDPVASWGLTSHMPAAAPKLCNPPRPTPLRLLLGQGRPPRARKCQGGMGLEEGGGGRPTRTEAVR